MTTLYTSTTVSVDGHVIRLDILTADEDANNCDPIDISLSADEPFLIEWDAIDKHECIEGSALTVAAESPGDRTFIPLALSGINKVFARLYSDNSMIWEGQLDPEQYEEPYTSGANYDVMLTFTDFGLLNRLDCDLEGYKTIAAIIDYCLDRIGITLPVEYNLGLYNAATNAPLTLNDFVVNTANFYDEDGKAMTLREVLETVLTPLAVRLCQKDGVIHVYTTQWLYDNTTPQSIIWDSDDQVLSFDKVYNKVTLTASPYVPDEILSGSLPEEVLKDKIGQGVMFNIDYDTNDPMPGFLFYTASRTEVEANYGDYMPGITLGQNASLFRITARYSGSDEVGYLWAARGNIPVDGQYYDYPLYGTTHSFLPNGPLVTIEGDEVIPSDKIRLRIKLDVMFDVRYNPFEDDGLKNEEGNYGRFQKYLNFGYVRCDLLVKDKDGNVVAWFDNAGSPTTYGSIRYAWEHKSYEVSGTWRTTPYNPVMYGQSCWLCYYDWEDRKNKAAFDGWTTNRRAIGYYEGKLPRSWSKMGDGYIISMPPVAGKIEFTVYPGIFANQEISANNAESKDAHARWLLFRNPAIELCMPNGLAPDDKETGDNEISAWLDPDAADDLDITLNYCTRGKRATVGRADILTPSLSPVGEYRRGSNIATAEHHLIGMIYSQHATPHITLSGTCKPFAFGLLTDESTPVPMLPVGEVYNVREDTMEVRAVELSNEDYTGLDIDEYA